MAGSSDVTKSLIEGMMRGERLALARAITLVENESEHAPTLIGALYAQTGRAHIVGVTGSPGSGKSTLVTALAREERARGRTVAIVAVDPTSPFTGGALLGDRVRMRTLSGDAGIFVRSMATRGSLGGLSKTTAEVALLLDGAGFDRIYIETVGAGQAEVEIAATAHTTLVVEAPGMGDEIQAIKAGILEIADLLVVNKADRPDADRTVQALEMMLELEGAFPRTLRHHGTLLPTATPSYLITETPAWQVKVWKSIASEGMGVAELCGEIERRGAWLKESGEWEERQRLRSARMVEGIVRGELMRRAQALLSSDEAQTLLAEVQEKRIDPYTAASRIIETDIA